jgi:hypothetical protein
MPNFSRQSGDYYGNVEGSFRSAKEFTWLMLAGWIAFPFVVQTCLHPADAALVMMRMQGMPHPEFEPRASIGAEIFALIMLATLCVSHFFVSVMFYRRAGRVVPMWPVAGVLLGIVGNGLWWYFTGAFDPVGALVGCVAVAVTVGCETLIDGRARNMAFGGANAGY